ncbi:Hypothetical predicted protein, partial [Olea europaea subsp. europaea]
VFNQEVDATIALAVLKPEPYTGDTQKVVEGEVTVSLVKFSHSWTLGVNISRGLKNKTSTWLITVKALSWS